MFLFLIPKMPLILLRESTAARIIKGILNELSKGKPEYFRGLVHMLPVILQISDFVVG